MKAKIFKILYTLFDGTIIGFFIFNTDSILEVYLENTFGNDKYILLRLIVDALSVFGLLILFNKTKNILYRVIVIAVMVALFFIGKGYATKVYQTEIETYNIMNSANSEENLSWYENSKMPDGTLRIDDNFLEGCFNRVNIFKKASETPSQALPWTRKHVEEIYVIQKEYCEFYKQFANGEIDQEKLSTLLINNDNESVEWESKTIPMPYWVTHFSLVK